METALRILCAALFGLAIGSFLTVASYRVPRKESVVAPRSRCPSCGTELMARDNVPVMSYVLLAGRCRTCRTRISVRYPLIELATAALFVGAVLHFHKLYLAIVMSVFFAVMLAVTIIDLDHKIIPNRIVYPSLIVFPVLLAIGAWTGQGFSLLHAGVGFLAFGGGLFLVAVVSPQGMGMGDVKLGSLIGLVLGSLQLRLVAVAAALGILAGGLGAVVALVFFGATRKKALPFGPYLAAGAVVSAFVGPKMATWYSGLMH